MASASLPQLTQRVGITLIASSGGTCLHLGCGAPFPSPLLLGSLPREPGRGLRLGQEDSLPQVLWELRGACGETGDSLTSLRISARPPPLNVGGRLSAQSFHGVFLWPSDSGFGHLGKEPSYKSTLGQNGLPFSPDKGRWECGLAG